MEKDLIGYLLKSLDYDEQRQTEAYLSSHPQERAKLELLGQAVEPLALDKDGVEPPADLALRTIGLVATHIVNVEGPIEATETSPVADFLRSIKKRDLTPTKKIDAPIYPWHGTDANPVQYSARNIIAIVGLSAALLLVSVTAILTIRQTRDVQACQNNMRVWNAALNAYCDIHEDRYPQVASNQEARTAFEQLHVAGMLPQQAAYTCPATTHLNAVKASGNDTFGASPFPQSMIDYAYSLGFRDDNGQLWGLTRGSENEFFPILADAPERRDGATFPINHRKGQNVLFAGGHARFCTNPFVGPEVGGRGDDIFVNTLQEARAGTHRWDSVLGRANEQP